MLSAKMIGNKITEARKKTNISQARLAEILSISSQAVGKWERGESMPDIITFNRLAEILDVDLNYFSESMHSDLDKTAGSESAGKQEDDLPTVKLKKKLSWDMSRWNWVDADFSGLKNLHDKFSSSNMQRCKFNGSDMSGLLLKSNNVDSCDFSGSDISNSRIQSSNLANNLYKDCSLQETKISRSNINGCDFSAAHLNGTEFSESHIYGCNFNGTDFTGVVIKSGGFNKNTITNAVWKRTSFINTQISDIVFDGTIGRLLF